MAALAGAALGVLLTWLLATLPVAAIGRSRDVPRLFTAVYEVVHLGPDTWEARITITNVSDARRGGWFLEFDLPDGQRIERYRGADMTRYWRSDRYAFFPEPNDDGIEPGDQVVIEIKGRFRDRYEPPSGCRILGYPCEIRSLPPAGPRTASPAPRTPTPTNPPVAAAAVAPYVDLGLTPVPDLARIARVTGLRRFTLSAVSGALCRATWPGGVDPRYGLAREAVEALRRAGGDVAVSFGGPAGVELAETCGDVYALVDQYQTVIDTYHLEAIDFDLTGPVLLDRAATDRRSIAIATLQARNPGLQVSLTLPASLTGLTPEGIAVLRSAQDRGVSVGVVNLLAMDFHRGSRDLGGTAIAVARAAFAQLKGLYPSKSDAQLWGMIGITVMAGLNDDGTVFGLADAQQLVAFAREQGLGQLAYWTVNRDQEACQGSLTRCTSVEQAPLAYAAVFARYTGPATSPDSTLPGQPPAPVPGTVPAAP